jgi:shikimate 5-dehydrogenase
MKACSISKPEGPCKRQVDTGENMPKEFNFLSQLTGSFSQGGENTDGKGFLMSLEGIVSPSGKRVILFGAGGAARAIGVELALAGASSISVVNRTAERGMELVRVINNHTPAKAELVSWQSNYKVPPDADIAINATSIGLYPRVHDRLDVDIETKSKEPKALGSKDSCATVKYAETYHRQH